MGPEGRALTEGPERRQLLLAQVVQLFQAQAGWRLPVTRALVPLPSAGRLQLLHLALQLVDVGLEALDGFGQTVRGGRRPVTARYETEGR